MLLVQCLHVSKNKQQGLSIIELLVSLAIGLLVLAGAFQVLAGSKRDFVDQNEIQFMQNNARYALNLMTQDLRVAGYLGCSTQAAQDVANTILDDANGFISLHGLRGFEGDSTTNSFPSEYKNTAIMGTDSFIVRYANSDSAVDVINHNPLNKKILLSTPHAFIPGSALVISDSSCRSVGLFHLSKKPLIQNDVIDYATDVGDMGPISNCTNVIKGNFSCASKSCDDQKCGGFDKNTGAYRSGSTIMSLTSHAYFVAPSNVMLGMSALKRRTLKQEGGGSTVEEEIAIGVEDFEIVYGVDSDSDGNVDQFLTAVEMDLDNDGVASDEEWGRVLNVKLSLVFRSKNPVLNQSVDKPFLGVTYNDKFMRQAVYATVRLRNRG